MAKVTNSLMKGVRAFNYCFGYAWDNFPIQFVKFFFFAVLVTNILLEENNNIIIFPTITYFMSLAFDSIHILGVEYGDSIGGTMVSSLHKIIFIGCIVAILALVFKDYMHLERIPNKRVVLNLMLIISMPHPLIEGYCNSLGDE